MKWTREEVFLNNSRPARLQSLSSKQVPGYTPPIPTTGSQKLLLDCWTRNLSLQINEGRSHKRRLISSSFLEGAEAQGEGSAAMISSCNLIFSGSAFSIRRWTWSSSPSNAQIKTCPSLLQGRVLTTLPQSCQVILQLSCQATSNPHVGRSHVLFHLKPLQHQWNPNSFHHRSLLRHRGIAGDHVVFLFLGECSPPHIDKPGPFSRALETQLGVALAKKRHTKCYKL